jgi:hypothetical protein
MHVPVHGLEPDTCCVPAFMRGAYTRWCGSSGMAQLVATCAPHLRENSSPLFFLLVSLNSQTIYRKCCSVFGAPKYSVSCSVLVCALTKVPGQLKSSASTTQTSYSSDSFLALDQFCCSQSDHILHGSYAHRRALTYMEIDGGNWDDKMDPHLEAYDGLITKIRMWHGNFAHWPAPA